MSLALRRRGRIWYLRGSVCGRHVHETTKLEDRALAEVLRIKRETALLNEYVFGAKAVRTFGEAAVSYIEQVGPQRFVDRLASRFNNRKLHDLTQNDLDRAARELYPTALAQTRIRHCYAPFIAIWNHAVRNGWADLRLWMRPRKLKGTNIIQLSKPRSGSRPVDYARAEAFVAAMSPAPAMVMTALFYTGMRPIELFGLEASDVDVERRWIVLKHTKTGEPRGVPMHEFLVPLFAGLAARGGRLFRTPRNKPYPVKKDAGGQLKTAINGARERSGILDVSPYTARHSVSTQLVVNGVHPYIKDQILGHAVDDMSRHYTNIPQAPLIAAINTLPVWSEMAWMKDPVAWQRRLVEGTGARNDLKKEET